MFRGNRSDFSVGHGRSLNVLFADHSVRAVGRDAWGPIQQILAGFNPNSSQPLKPNYIDKDVPSNPALWNNLDRG